MNNSKEENIDVNLTNYLPLRDVVYNSVRDAILSETLKPGKRLMEIELADMLGVSRTPVREALRKLEAEGFVEMPPRKGAIVKTTSIKDIQDVLEIRSTLEALATRIACEKMGEEAKKDLEKAKNEFIDAVSHSNIEGMLQTDINFHDIIFSATQNERLIQIINNLKEQIYRYRSIYIRDKSYLQHIIKEHEEIFQAIFNNDTKKAEEAAVIHIKKQENALVRALKL